jgi:hypothetical protein
VTSGALSVGDTLTGTGLTPGTFITSFNAGNGTYNIYPSYNVSVPDLAAAPTRTLFQMSKQPTTALSVAEVCGGICALFDTAATTGFAPTWSAGRPNNSNWASGFLCIKGADIVPIPVVSGSVKNKVWFEVVH